MSPLKKWLLAASVAAAAIITEIGNRTASVPLSRVSLLGWKVATAIWPAGIHEGTVTAAMGSIIVAFVVNVVAWTVVLYSGASLLSRLRKAPLQKSG